MSLYEDLDTLLSKHVDRVYTQLKTDVNAPDKRFAPFMTPSPQSPPRAQTRGEREARPAPTEVETLVDEFHEIVTLTLLLVLVAAIVVYHYMQTNNRRFTRLQQRLCDLECKWESHQRGGGVLPTDERRV